MHTHSQRVDTGGVKIYSRKRRAFQVCNKQVRQEAAGGRRGDEMGVDGDDDGGRA
jgi:hypothetical protein